jgi:predicted MFS family arabinose efflux permease
VRVPPAEFVRPFLESNASATPFFITAALMIFGAGGAIGNFIAGHTVARSVRASFVVGAVGLVGSLLLLLAIGHRPVAPMIVLAIWGMSFGVVQLCQLTMTQAAAPDTFEAAMSLNTMAYNTSIAIADERADRGVVARLAPHPPPVPRASYRRMSTAR